MQNEQPQEHSRRIHERLLELNSMIIFNIFYDFTNLNRYQPYSNKIYRLFQNSNR